MKKAISLLLALVMILVAFPTSVFALNRYVVYEGTDNCNMTAISIDKSQNSWMLYDVTFADSDNGRVWTSNEEHPSLVGCEVKLTLEWVGDSLTFNGKAFKDGDKVTLKETNELIVYADNELTKAEYTIVIKEETRGLPVVLIDTNNAPIPDKLNYVDASISVLGSEVYGSKSQNIYSAVAGIKLRGNSTMGYAKKPYRIKFDKKQNVLGLGKAKSWVLLADYLDPSSLRNTIAYNFAERVNATTAALTGKAQVFAPRMKLVEVYLNGQFQGLYEMGDHMQANELRVPVNELGDEDDPDQYDSEDIGFFIEVEVKDRVLKEGKPGYEDWSAYSYITDIGADAGSDGIYAQVINDKDKNQYLIDESDMGKSVLYFQFKLPEDPTDKHKAYITDYMQQVNDLILANDERVWDLVDLDSVVNWYIVNELFKNADSQMQSSVYFYKHGSTDIDGNDADGKLYMAPVWDFDLGAGGVTYGDMDDPTEWRTRNDEYCGWFRELFETTTFSNAVDARWALLRNNGSFDLLFNDIATYSSTYKEAAEADFALWHDSYVREVNATSWLTVPNVALTGDWPAQVSYLQYWLYQRMMWMDTGFGYTNTPWQENEVLTGQKLANIFNNYTIYAPQDGNCIVKIPMDLNIPIDRMAIDMDFSCNVPFNIKFATTYNTVYSGVSFSKAGNLAGDWSNDAALGSNKPSNGRVPAGTYKGLRPTLSGVFTWTLGGSNYSSYTGLTGTQGANSATIGKNLKNYLKSAYLTEIQIEFFGAAAGQSAATFTINMYDQNYDIRENVSGYDPIPDSKAFSQTVIGGAPFIVGEPKVGNTLTISTVGITPYNADVHYLWYVDGKAVASDSPTTYVVKASDFGKQISAKVVGVFKYTGEVNVTPVTITGDGTVPTVPAAPTVSQKTTNSITLTAKANQEYTLDGGETWYRDLKNTGSITISGLTAGKCYTVYTRVIGNGMVSPASEWSQPTVVLTNVLGTAKGDVNADGSVTTRDAVLALEKALEFIDMRNEEVLALADYDDDGEITTSDARQILMAIVNN